MARGLEREDTILLQQGLRSRETGLVTPQTPWSLAVLVGHEGRWAALAGLVPICPRGHFSQFDPKEATLVSISPPCLELNALRNRLPELPQYIATASLQFHLQ